MAFDSDEILKKIQQRREAEKTEKKRIAQKEAAEAQAKAQAQAEAEKRAEQQRIAAQRAQEAKAREEEAAKNRVAEEERLKREAEEQALEAEKRQRELEELKLQEEFLLKKQMNPNTIFVGSGKYVDYHNLFEAVKNAKDGNILNISESAYEIDGLEINKSLHFVGEGNVYLERRKDESGMAIKISNLSSLSFEGITFLNHTKYDSSGILEINSSEKEASLDFKNCGGLLRIGDDCSFDLHTLTIDNCNFSGLHVDVNKYKKPKNMKIEVSNSTIDYCHISGKCINATFTNTTFKSDERIFTLYNTKPTCVNCTFYTPEKKLCYQGSVKLLNSRKADISELDYTNQSRAMDIKRESLMHTLDTLYVIAMVLATAGGCFLGVKIWKFTGFFIFGAGFDLLLTFIYWLIRTPVRKRHYGRYGGKFPFFLIGGICLAILLFFLSFKLFFLIEGMWGFFKFVFALIVGAVLAIGSAYGGYELYMRYEVY